MVFDPNTLSGLRNFNEDVYFNNKASFFENVTLQKDVTINGVTRTKEIIGSFTGNITGNLTGNVVGDLSGSVRGDLNSSGISTVTELRVLEALYDRNNDFGSAGQVLSSDGTGLEWINTSDANVGSASNVGTNLNETNSNQFLTFVAASSGNNPIRIDSHLTYNPSTNTMSGINYSGVSTFTDLHVTGQLRDGDGDFGSSGQVLSSDGTNTNWINASSLSAGASAQVAITATNDNSSFFVTFVDNSTGNNGVKVDTNLTYNASTNTLTAGTFSGNASASNLNTGTIPNARFPSTLPAISGANLTNLDASDLASGTIPDARFPSSLPAIDGSALTGIVSIPTGVIVMWSGSIANIPSGWALCDGTNSTPDLRNRFIVGAHSDGSTGVTFNATTGATSGNYGPGNTGGETAHQLTVAELAAHTHTEQYNVNSSGQDQAGSGSGDNDNTSTRNSGSTGGNNYHENRPPYYALAFIMKT